jgi:hypothetical protein
MDNKIILMPSSIWKAYDEHCIGSKVKLTYPFEIKVREAIRTHDTSKDRAEGQHFLPISVEGIVSCGVGLNTRFPEDYVLRNWRGRVQPFLKREHALPLSSCSVIVYTKQAYLNDPQIDEAEAERVNASDATHILVALLANAKGVPNAYGTYRLVSNLAGGNNAFENITIEEIKEQAAASLQYEDTWCVVAD